MLSTDKQTDKQTDRQTDKLTNTTKHNLLSQGGNDYVQVFAYEHIVIQIQIIADMIY